jgi:hypothetical protein
LYEVGDGTDFLIGDDGDDIALPNACPRRWRTLPNG